MRNLLAGACLHYSVVDGTIELIKGFPCGGQIERLVCAGLFNDPSALHVAAPDILDQLRSLVRSHMYLHRLHMAPSFFHERTGDDWREPTESD